MGAIVGGRGKCPGVVVRGGGGGGGGNCPDVV